MNLIAKVFWIAGAGAAGALARYGITGLVFRIYGGTFPAGTFIVNVVGCFLFGLIWPLAEERLIVSGELRTIILVGFVGSFTTFSTLIFESQELLRDAQWLAAAVNIFGQTILGLAALLLGLWIGRSI